MKQLLRNPVAQVAIVLAFLTLATLFTPLPLGQVTQIAIYVLYAAGIGLLVGYLGLVPFGGSVYFGIASYATALTMLHWFPNVGVLAGLAFSVAFAVLVAMPVGALILRRRGLYFSLLTLASAQIAFEIAFKWTEFTGGENGLQDVPRQPLLESGLAFHFFTVVLVLAALGLLWRFAHSPLCRVFQAIRDNEQRAASLGYDIYRVKLIGFVISAAVTGLAGGLLALHIRGAYANPLSWEHAADALFMTLLGGMHHFIGALWGAVLFIVLQDQLSALLSNWWLIFAPVLMLVVLAAPEGIHGLILRALGGKGWTLVRSGTPERPEHVPPFLPEESVHQNPGRPLLTVKNLSKSFGSITVASGYDFEVFPGTLHSFIGPNGAGKTTFFNMLSGTIVPDGGTIGFLDSEITRMPVHKRVRLGLGRSFQIVSVFANLTAFENVRIAVSAGRPNPLAFWRDAYSWPEVNLRTWSLLEAIGLAHKAKELCTDLSHGERRLLEIGITLATQARLILLDEPLAGLGEADRERVATLISAVARAHAILLIEHDIDRVIAISDRITVLHQGRIIADGKPGEVARHPEVMRAYLGDPTSVQQVTRDRDFARKPPEILLDVRDLVAGYQGGRVLDGVSLRVGEGECVALLGRNGVGKTTMLRTIYGLLAADEGSVQWSGRDISDLRPFEISRLGIAMVPEGRRLFLNLTVLDNLLIAVRKGGMSLDEVFELFPRLRMVQKSRAENISGGERQMVAIARALLAPSRLILLDEPFEGLAPVVVAEVMAAIARLRGKVAMILVEHHPEQVLSLVDRAIVLVNGKVAYEGDPGELSADAALQARLLGVVEGEAARPRSSLGIGCRRGPAIAKLEMDG